MKADSSLTTQTLGNESLPHCKGGEAPDKASRQNHPQTPNRGTLHIVLLYVFFAATWILFSDRFLALLVKDPDTRMEWSIFKGLVFVLVTGTMLYFLIYRLASQLQRAQQEADKYRQAQKMDSIGRLAGGISHDFNNILTSIFGNLELALSSLPTNHTAQEYLEDCRHEASEPRPIPELSEVMFERQWPPVEEKKVRRKINLAESYKIKF